MTEGPELSLEEFAQLVTGPNRFVMDWVGDVLADRVEAVWGAMSHDFRQCFAQMWVSADPRAEGEDRDQLVDRLLGETDRLFRAMRADVVRSIRKSFGDGPFDDLGVGARPQPVGPELELVRLFHTAGLATNHLGHHYMVPGAIEQAIGVIVARTDDGWEVAGIGHQLLRPGWPPARVDIA